MLPVISKYYAATREYVADTVLGDTGFFFHFSAYVLVNLILIAVNLLTTPDQLWFYWPLLGWGIGILAHGLAVNFSAEERVRRRARTRGAATPKSRLAGLATHAFGHQFHDLQRELRLLGDQRQERRFIDDRDLGCDAR